MIAISGLGFSYGKTRILSDITMTMSPGQVVCLIGPNGAGKSTLLKCINRILRPNAGTVLLDGRRADALGRQELARFIAYVPQNAGPGMFLKVLDVVALGRAPHRGLASAASDRQIVWEALERLGLASLAFRPFGELSGGQRQRVLIARALAQNGRLMLMDEPTSNLDPYYQVETISTIRALAKERNVAALVAIHDLSLAARLADVVILMSQGCIRAEGTWQHVMTHERLRSTFGISVLTGEDGGLPYVIPFKATSVPTHDPYPPMNAN